MILTWGVRDLKELTLKARSKGLKHKCYLRGPDQAMAYQAPALLQPLELADTQSPIYVVVDAVDEFMQEAYKLVPEMLKWLMAATQHDPLRIFLTFRPDRLVENKLLSSQWSNIIHTISIDTFSEDANRDVATFI